jgi:hypothetical protein
MKNLTKQLAGVTIITLSLGIFAGCDNVPEEQIAEIATTENITTQTETVTSEDYVIDESDYVDGNELISEIAESELSEEEIEGLILMREEEKLARDVYLMLGDTWETPIFTNIASSEQTHTDAVKVLLDRYDIEDPIENDAIGVFNSPELAQLYEDLIEQGNKSLLDAFIVGVTIEDLDIKDLNELLEQTDNADIIATYNNLNKGSRNHLRAYMRQVTNSGGTYEAQFISQTELEAIISATQERGRV